MQNILPPVLLYHILDSSMKSSISISPSVFEEHLITLVKHNFQSITPKEYCSLLSGINTSSCRNPILITFDDAYEDCLTIAAPLLYKYGFSATVFVNTNAVGSTNDWNPKATYRRKHLDWSGISELTHYGFEIGAHSCTHRSFLKLTSDEIEKETTHSKEMIGKAIGFEATCFAYPYGDYSEEAVQIVSEHYNIAFGVEVTACNRLPIKYRIPRISLNFRHTGDIFCSAIEVSLWTLSEVRYR